MTDEHVCNVCGGAIGSSEYVRCQDGGYEHVHELQCVHTLTARLAAAEAERNVLRETNANNVACYQMQLEDIHKERGDRYLSAECRTHGCQVHRLMAEVERFQRGIAESYSALQAKERRLAAAEALAPCGHENRFTEWEDHSKPISCVKCRLAEAEARNAGGTCRILSGKCDCTLCKQDAKIAELTKEVGELRGLLREATALEYCEEHGGPHVGRQWYERAKQAGGTK